eukprot:scaffold360894_cov24-Attheya_sp.AAC.1
MHSICSSKLKQNSAGTGAPILFLYFQCETSCDTREDREGQALLIDQAAEVYSHSSMFRLLRT